MKVVLAGVLGGIVMFVWGAISHMALPIGEAGLRSVPPEREEALAREMRGALTERALYLFPAMDMSRPPTAEEQKALEAKVAAGPVALIAYSPRGGATLSARELLTELGSNVVACMAAAFALLHVPAGVGYFRRVALVAAFGVYAWAAIDASQWNWYRFPTAYFLAQFVDGVVGAALAGLVIARVARPPAA